MNRPVVKMQSVSLKIKMLFVNARLVIEVIQFQKLVVNWLMPVHTVQNHPFVKYHQLVRRFANVHKAIPAIQIQRDASQLVNVLMAIPIARTAPNVSMVVVSISVMDCVDRI